MGERGPNAKPKGAGSHHTPNIEGLSSAKYGALTGLPWGPDPFKSDEEFWRAWKLHRKEILAAWTVARRPYAYWLEVLPEDEPFPVWHADQAYMLRQLGLCKNQAERDEVDKILAAVRCDMDARYVEARATARWK